MLFCSSFTQSERFFQTDQLIIRLQVVVMTNFIRMSTRNVFVNVFMSGAVIWWAAIFRRGWFDEEEEVFFGRLGWIDMKEHERT